MEHQFNEGEKILCFEPMLGRSRVLYEAKVSIIRNLLYLLINFLEELIIHPSIPFNSWSIQCFHYYCNSTTILIFSNHQSKYMQAAVHPANMCWHWGISGSLTRTRSLYWRGIIIYCSSYSNLCYRSSCCRWPVWFEEGRESPRIGWTSLNGIKCKSFRQWLT